MCDCWRIGDESFAQGDAPFSTSDFKESRKIYEKCIENFDELENFVGQSPRVALRRVTKPPDVSIKPFKR